MYINYTAYSGHHGHMSQQWEYLLLSVPQVTSKKLQYAKYATKFSIIIINNKHMNKHDKQNHSYSTDIPGNGVPSCNKHRESCSYDKHRHSHRIPQFPNVLDESHFQLWFDSVFQWLFSCITLRQSRSFLSGR